MRRAVKAVFVACVVLGVVWGLVSAQSQNKPKVAVYVMGGNANENKMWGARMTHALVNSGRYTTIERSEAFLNQVAAEQAKQRSGAIDDSQISELGRQFGVGFVCIVEIVEFEGEKQVSARIVNVETVVIEATGLATWRLKSGEDMEKSFKDIVATLLSAEAASVPTALVSTTPAPKPTKAPKPKPAPKPAKTPKPKPAPKSTPTRQFNPNITYGSVTDSRDGQSYRTVKIGDQTWMAENLNYNASGSVCKNKLGNCTKYGRLYNWSTVMAGSSSSSSSPSGRRGVCPSGWHVPSDAEWTILVDYVGGAFSKLKSATGWYTGSGYIPGTDDYGFSALPGGYRSTEGTFYNVGSYGSWWSATENGAVGARYRSMYYGVSYVFSGTYDKTNQLSLRCLQDVRP
jgi:uncharacterized protein (TIGR02145 family)